MATFILELGIRRYRLASNSYRITTEGIAHNIYQIEGSVRPRADTDNWVHCTKTINDSLQAGT